mgnify:FL=1
MNGMGQGLAASSVSSNDELVREVVTLLMQGVDPEEIVKQGVPVEVVRQAVEIVLAQESQMETRSAPANTEAGLAMTAAGM